MNKPRLPRPARRSAPGPNGPDMRQRQMTIVFALMFALGFTMVNANDGPPQPTYVELDQALSDVRSGRVEVVSINDDARTMLMTYRTNALAAAAAEESIRQRGKAAGDDSKRIDARVEAAAERQEKAKGDAQRQVIVNFPYPFADDLVTEVLTAKVRLDAEHASPPSVWAKLGGWVPTLLIIGFLIWMIRGKGLTGGIGNFSGGRGKLVDVPSTRFADVAGADEAVAELREVVQFLHAPESFSKTGARVPRGFLLVGPPGTGKTLLARATAGEAGVPFFSVSGSDFVETFVGVGAKRVRDLFDKARKIDGPSIIFVDELDSIGRQRTGGPSNGGADETERTLNQLLVELDGFDKSQIFILAATNRPDMLDSALTRPGRFDRQIAVPAPDRAGRAALFELHLKGKPAVLDGDGAIDVHSLARRTPGMTGADIGALVNEASLTAARRGADRITQADMDAAVEVTALGRERRSAVVTERDRRITAWHEGGHTVCALLLEHASDPVSVTIVPRGPAGGVTWMSGSDNAFMTRSEALAQLAVAMGGRAAELILLDGDFSQGASGDIQSATHLAVQMVTEYGMSELGLARRGELLPYGDTASEVAAEVDQLLAHALSTASSILAANEQLLARVAEELLERETLSLADVQSLADEINGIGDAGDQS